MTIGGLRLESYRRNRISTESLDQSR